MFNSNCSLFSLSLLIKVGTILYENVDIVGNKAVNIGGGRINIAGSSNNINGDSTNYTAGYINIVSTALDFSKNANNSIEE